MDENDLDEKASQEVPEEELNTKPDPGQVSSVDSFGGDDGNQPRSQSGQDGDALSWLEGPAFNAPIEELPTLRWPEDRSKDDQEDLNEQDTSVNLKAGSAGPSNKTEPINDLDDAMTWLEQLAVGQGTPIDEMPTLVTSANRKQGGPISDPQNLAVDENAIPLGAGDSDPMAWLEQLAVDQSSPLEELPSVADRLLASEIISQTGNGLEGQESLPMSIELDDALIFLESLALAQGISLDEVSISGIELDESFDGDFTMLDRMAEVSVAAAIIAPRDDEYKEAVSKEDWDDLSTQIPEDPDEALAWLGGLADEETEEGDSHENYLDQPDTANQDNLQTAGLAINQSSDAYDSKVDEEFLEEMPEDPDEAMAWMKGLSVQHDEDTNIKHEEPIPVKESEEKLSAGSEEMELARSAISSGDKQAAAEHYRTLIEKSEGGDKLIQELEAVIADNPEDPQLLQLLGDAYMKEGHLQKALKTYRKQLAHS